MNIVIYALVAYGATAVISLGIIGIIVLINQILQDKKGAE